MEYPKWKYHVTEAAHIVDTAEDDGKLGKGWYDSPTEAFEKDEPVIKPPHHSHQPAQKK